MAGMIVQIISISCPSLMNLLCVLLGNREERTNMVSVVIRIKMVMMWS